MSVPVRDRKKSQFEALYEKAMVCKKGVSWKGSVASYFFNAIEETLKLERELRNGTYEERPTKQFKVMHPKERNVVSIAFRDRVYQRSLNDNIVYPIMTAPFIRNNMACQKGKGTDLARETLLYMIRDIVAEAHWKVGNLVAIQCDIRKYYDSMEHRRTEDMFTRRLSPVPGASDCVVRILRKQYTQEKGYNPGSQLVQIAGISVLDPMDHFITEELGVRHYLRYMDDFIILTDSFERAEEYRERISRFIGENIGLELHPKKTRIFSLTRGLTFLGFEYHVSHTGQTYMLLAPAKTKETRKKLVKMVHLAKKGVIGRADCDNTYQQYRNYAKKGRSHRLLARMDRFYQELWKEDDAV